MTSPRRTAEMDGNGLEPDDMTIVEKILIVLIALVMAGWVVVLTLVGQDFLIRL